MFWKTLAPAYGVVRKSEHIQPLAGVLDAFCAVLRHGWTSCPVDLVRSQMIDLDALSELREVHGGCMPINIQQLRTLIAELRASRKVVEAAATYRREEEAYENDGLRGRMMHTDRINKARVALDAELEALK